MQIAMGRIMTRTARILRLAFPALAMTLALALLVAPCAAQSTYLPGAEPPPRVRTHADSVLTIEVHPLAPGVFAAKVRYVWTGWVELPGGILLIDTSMDEKAAQALADTIRSRSGPRPVKYVVNTHAHVDHCGGNRIFAERGATVMAQASVAARIDSLMAAAVRRSTADGSSPSTTRRTLKPCLRIERRKSLGPAGRRVEIIWLGKPAHTGGDLVVYLAKQKILFAGDLISNHAVPWMLDPGMNREGWIASVDSLRSKAFSYTILVPGHGEYAEPLKGFRSTRGYLEDAYVLARRNASWGVSVSAVKDWGDLGAFQDAEFYAEVHFMNMRRLYNEALGIKTPGRPNTRAIKN